MGIPCRLSHCPLVVLQNQHGTEIAGPARASAWCGTRRLCAGPALPPRARATRLQEGPPRRARGRPRARAYSSPGKAGISGLHSRLPRGVRPRLEGKPRTPPSSRVTTRVFGSPLSGVLMGSRISQQSAGDTGLPVSRRPGFNPLEKEMAVHSSILAWRIPWTVEPGWLQSMGLQRVGHD